MQVVNHEKARASELLLPVKVRAAILFLRAWYAVQAIEVGLNAIRDRRRAQSEALKVHEDADKLLENKVEKLRERREEVCRLARVAVLWRVRL